MLLLFACAHTPAPPTDVATPEAPAEPVAEAIDAEAPAPICDTDAEAVYTQQHRLIRAVDGPVSTLTILVSGHWSLDGTQSGCMSESDRMAFLAQLAAADITAPPLGPGEARCMAMPSSEITVTAREQTATWQAPCGASNPSPSLDALVRAIPSMTTPPK